MAPILEQLNGVLVALGLLFFAGYPVATLLLPNEARRWFWLATPLAGLATASVALGWLGIFFPMAAAAWALLALGAAATVALALRRRWSPAGQAWREQATVAGLACLSLALGLLPLWGQPDLLALGPNWDIEIYLPLAEYLKRWPAGFSLAELSGRPFADYPNPLLWRVNFFDPRSAGLAFQQLHAAVGVLAGQEAHQHFAGLLALLYALSLPAGFLLLRAGLGLSFPHAALTTALLAINAAGLYIVFWSFGQQTISLALLPFALLGLALALQRPARPTVLLAGLGLAALLAGFVPVAPLYGVLLVGLILVSLPGPARWAGGAADLLRPLTVVAGTLAVSLALAPWAYLSAARRAYHFWDEQGLSGLSRGPDVAQFPSFGWALGLFRSPEGGLAGLLDPQSGLEGLLAPGLRFLLLLLMAVGAYVAVTRRQFLLVAVGVPPLLLLVGVRYLWPYPYGYLKLLPSSSFLLLALVVAGGVGLWQMAGELRQPRLPRAGIALGAAVLAALTAGSTGQLIGSIRGQSTAEYRTLQGLAEAIPPGASVLVSGYRDYQGPKAGALAYFLRKTNLYGYVQTGFSTFFRLRDDGVYDFAIFNELEDSQRELYPEGQRVWQGLGLKAYRTPEAVEYYRDLGAAVAPPVIEASAGQGKASGLRITDWTEEGYPEFQGWSPPLLGVLAETTPPQVHYPEVVRRGNLDLTVPQPALEADAAESLGARGGRRMRPELAVTLASFRDQRVTLVVNGQPHALNLTPGLASYRLGRVALPARLTLYNESNFPVFVKSLMLRQTEEGSARVERFPDVVLVRWATRPTEGGLRLAVDYIGPAWQPVVDIYGLDGKRHYGYWSLPSGPASVVRTYRLRLDLPRQQTFTLQRGGETRVIGWQGERAEGDYRGYLFLWQGQKLAQSVPLFTFTLRDNQITGIEEEAGELFIG
ncbi:MAG: hypothetical protein HYY02_11550 [Chloroflexi bacterium]|nr:hypothetical protein [Chloroflexota bacterium]